MPHLARGAAYVDLDGNLLAADHGFRLSLGLAEPGGPRDLIDRAAAQPALRAAVAGAGPATVDLDGPLGRLSLERLPTPGGALLLLRSRRDGERMEHSVSSQGMARVAGGLAHDIKNCLNAMALQLALLEEKVGEGEVAHATAGHLAALHEQVSKVNEVVRRFCDVADPSTPYAWVDLGATLHDIAGLFGHDFRRRRIVFELEAPRGVARAAVRPDKAVRLLLGVFGRAVARTPEGGGLAARAGEAAGQSVVTIEHATAAADPELGYDTEVAAAAARSMGGSLEIVRDGGQERVSVRLPRGSQP